jgi:hypothetical protein
MLCGSVRGSPVAASVNLPWQLIFFGISVDAGTTEAKNNAEATTTVEAIHLLVISNVPPLETPGRYGLNLSR